MVMSPVYQVWQNHLVRHSENGKKTRQTEKEVGIQHHGMDKPGVRRVPEGCGEQRKIEEAGCKIICGSPTTLANKGLILLLWLVREPPILLLFLLLLLLPLLISKTKQNKTKQKTTKTFASVNTPSPLGSRLRCV